MSNRIDSDKLRELWAGGVSSSDIAVLFGVQYPAVNRAAKAIGLLPRPRGAPAKKPAASDAGQGRAPAARRAAPRLPDAAVVTDPEFSDADLIDLLQWLAHGMRLDDMARRKVVRRDAIVAVLRSIGTELQQSELAPLPAGATRATKPENRNGGMPARWWEAGLDLQKRRAA